MRFIILFCLCFTSAVAQEDVLLTRLAEAYFQAKEFDKAQELYEKLLEEKLFPWQQARLIYNMGTILLAQERWNEALADFGSIPYYPQAAPLLSRRLKTNTAILQYRQATLLTMKGDLSLDEYSRAFYLYREALRNIEEAENADCLLQTFEGKEQCQPSQDLVDLHSAVKTQLAEVTRKFGEAKLSESPVKEGIPFLLSGNKLVLSHVDFLQSKKLNDKLEKRYSKLYIRDAESWLSLWDSQKEKMGEVEEAERYFIDGIEYMKQNQLDESRIAFMSSTASLSELIQKLWGIDPLLELLQELLSSYQRSLDQVPVQTSTLYQLQTEQSQVREVVEIEDLVIQELNFSDEYLAKSLKYSREAKSTLVRFFLEEARQWIRRLFRQKSVPDEEAPDELLEDAIQEQIHALTLNHLSHEIIGDKEGTEEILQTSQEITLGVVEPFLSAVLAKEIKEFPTRCQCKPWDKVIPLFDKGQKSAESAQDILKTENLATFAMPMQEATIKYWKEALKNMREPEEEEEKPEEKKEEEVPPEEAPPPEPEEGTSVQEVMRLLQKMEQEDRMPRPEEIVPERGIRPW